MPLHSAVVSGYTIYFFAGAISDAVGALFSLILFWGMVNPGIRSELSKERGGIVV